MAASVPSNVGVISNVPGRVPVGTGAIGSNVGPIDAAGSGVEKGSTGVFSRAGVGNSPPGSGWESEFSGVSVISAIATPDDGVKVTWVSGLGERIRLASRNHTSC